MNKMTLGKYEAYKVECKPDLYMVCAGDDGELGIAKMIDDNQQANAKFYATCANECQKVNPDNPQAVAERIEKMHQWLRFLTKQDSFVRHFPDTSNDIKNLLKEIEAKE